MNIKLSGKKVLVTGGAGFIGSNLTEELHKMGNKVIVLDNLITGKKKNLDNLLNKRDFIFIEGDIRNPKTCIDAAQEVDIIFHQAALGSVPRSIENPVLTTEVNIAGTVNMLDAAVKTNVKRFVYAASSSTYGDSLQMPKVEDKIGKPLSPYAITKYVNELYAETFSRIYGLETIGLRYFNVFGRKQDPEGAYAAVIPKFVMSIKNNKQPIINGDGTYSRDFTYIDNVVQANILAAITTDKNALNTVYNVACGESTSLNTLFSLIKNEVTEYNPDCKNIEPIYGKNRQGDIPHSLASIDKAVKILGYEPQYNVQQGLHEAVKWYINNL